MSIEFLPPALGYLVNDERSVRRLRNRDGSWQAHDQDGKQMQAVQEGPFLDMLKFAREFEQENPQSIVTVAENSCGGYMSPRPPQLGKKD